MEDCDMPPPELSPEEHEAALQLQDAKRLERQKPLDPHPGDADLPKVHSDDSV